MTEFKNNKLVCGIIALVLCLVFFSLQFTSILPSSQKKSMENIKQTNDPIVSNNNSPQQQIYTYDSKWKAKNYTSPSSYMMDKIMSNSISYKENTTKTDPITKEKNSTITTKNVLLTAVVNSGMKNYTLNWIASLKKTQQDDKFLVFAIDQGVVDDLIHHGYEKNVVLIPKEWLHAPLTPDFSLWKTSDYRYITHAKSLIIERLLYLNMNVWFSDVDVVFLNPHILDAILVQMSDRPNTHMIFSQETVHRTVNSGFFVMKPSKITKQFMATIIEEQDKPNNQLSQQKIMNKVLKAMFPRDYVQSPYRFLDLLLFPNGKYYFRMNLPTRLGIRPMMVHANYFIGDKKMDALEEAGLWFIE